MREENHRPTLPGLSYSYPHARSSVRRLIGTVFPIFGSAVLLLRHADKQGPLPSILGQASALGAAMGLIGQAFRFRHAWLARYGSAGAYEHAMWRAMVPGAALFWAAAAHLLFVPGGRRFRFAVPSAAYLATTGLALVIAAYRTIGFDALTLRYVFFPGNGALVRSGALEHVRHPGYSGLIRLALAVALLRGDVRALLTAMVTPLAFITWITLVEEPELVSRFGAAYVEYRSHTPALFVFAPSRWLAFWRSLHKAIQATAQPF